MKNSKNLTQDVLRLVEKHGTKWSLIAEETGESADKVRSIYRRYSSKNVSSDVIKVAFPTDQHHPFVDKRAQEVALKIVEDFDPDILVEGSDTFDFYSLSCFDKNPHRLYENSVKHEITEWKKSMRRWLNAAPNAEVYFLIGNHEERWYRELYRTMFYDAIRLETLCEFDKFGIEFAKNNEVIVNNKLIIHHGTKVSKYSAYSAKIELESMMGYSSLSGHTHRAGTHYVTIRNQNFVAQEGFCLCDMNPGYIKNPNWQQGTVLTTVSDYGVHFEPIQIFTTPFGKKFAYWRDKKYVA